MYHVTGQLDREPYEALIFNPCGPSWRENLLRGKTIIHLEVHKLEFEVDWPLMPSDMVFVKR